MAEGHGQAHFTAAPADKVGWYMTVLNDCSWAATGQPGLVGCWIAAHRGPGGRVEPHVLSCFATGLAGEVAPCLGEDEREVCAVRNAPDVVGVLSDVHSQWLTGRTPAVRGEGMACS